MARPHLLLLDLAAGRTPRRDAVDDAAVVAASAFEHRMGGLLWSAVARGDIPITGEASHLLALDDLAVQAHHRRLWLTLVDIHDRLSAIGIQVAAIKGVAAEARWYDRLGERPCTDLDLLLEPRGQYRLDEVLEALAPDFFLRADAPKLMQSSVLQSLDLDVSGIEVDVHADLLKVEIPTRGTETLWARTTTVVHDEASVRVLDAETSLIQFLMHLHKDRFSRLLGYADVARIIERETLDWAFIDDFLAREGLRVHAYSALHAVATALDLAVPPVPIPHGWRARAWRKLWPPERALSGQPGFASRLGHQSLWIPWLADGRLSEAVRWWLRRRAFPPDTLVRVYYPNVRGPYLVRLIVGRLRRAGGRTRSLPS